MTYGGTCLVGGYVLWEDISYRNIYILLEDMFVEDISYRRTCLIKGHI